MITAMFVLIWSTLYRIQILDADKYKEPFYQNELVEEEIQSVRGCIYDRYGRLLAGNEVSQALYLSLQTTVPDLNTALSQLLQIAEKNGDTVSVDQPLPIAYDENKGFYFIPTYDIGYSEIRFYNFLAEVYGTSRAYLTDEQKKATAEEVYIQMRTKTFRLDESYSREEALAILRLRYAIFVARAEEKTELCLIQGVSEQTKIEVLERSTDFPGFSVKEQYTRVYPQGDLFAHIIGYMGEISEDELAAHKNDEKTLAGYKEGDRIGKTGLEAVYEEALRGTSGVRQIELDGKTGEWVGEKTLVQAVNGNDIYLSIEIEVQKNTTNRLYAGIKELLIPKITGTSSRLTYSVGDIYEALIDNNFISLAQIEASDSSYSSCLSNIYASYSERYIAQLSSQILSSQTPMSSYPEILMDIYNVMIENMRNNLHLSYAYQNDEDFYEDYAAGRKTAREFLEYCVQNGYLDKNAYGLGQEENIDIILSNVVEHEMTILRRTAEFKKLLYKYILSTGAYSHNNFWRLLYEQGLLSNEDGSLDRFNRGQLSLLNAIKQKIQDDEITPAQLNLDPCSGSVSMVDPTSGEVLALVSYPSFDSNRISDSDYFTQLLQDKSSPLTFRALSELRAPGPTFKLCTSLASLDLGYININSKVYDYYAYPNVNSATKPVCWSRASHGLINVVKAIEYSCNYFFYDMGYRLSDPAADGSFNDAVGLEKLATYSKMLGLGTKTGIELDEAEPQVSTQDAVRSAIGQGTNAYSAANLSRYTATIANGGTVYDLYLVKRIVAPGEASETITEPRVNNVAEISKENFDIVRSGMRSVVTSSGTLSVLDANGIHCAGKTGTAEEATDRPDHTVYTGYSGYGEEPDIVVSIIISFGGGSSFAVSLFRDIMLDYYSVTLPTT